MGEGDRVLTLSSVQERGRAQERGEMVWEQELGLGEQWRKERVRRLG
jgi:hypothetical protein